MTNYSKVLTTTLLATSVIAFSASASNDKFEVTVSTRTKQASPVNTYVTDDVRRFSLLQNADDKTNKSGKALPKGVVAKAMNQPLTIDFGSRKGVERELTKTDGSKEKRTYTIDTSKPSEVVSVMIATVPVKGRRVLADGELKRGDTKSVVDQDAAKDSLVRRFDLATSKGQLALIDARKAEAEQDKRELEWLSTSLKNLTATYNKVYGVRVSYEEIFTALKETMDENEKTRPVREEIEITKYGVVARTHKGLSSAYAEAIAKKAIAAIDPLTARGWQLVTKTGDLHKELVMQGHDRVDFPVEDATNLARETDALLKLNYQVRVLSDKVTKDLEAAEASKMWWYVKEIKEGRAKFKAPAPVTTAADATAAETAVVEQAQAGVTTTTE